MGRGGMPPCDVRVVGEGNSAGGLGPRIQFSPTVCCSPVLRWGYENNKKFKRWFQDRSGKGYHSNIKIF